MASNYWGDEQKRKYFREYRRMVRQGIIRPKKRGPRQHYEIRNPNNDHRNLGPPLECFDEEPRVPDVGPVWDFSGHNVK